MWLKKTLIILLASQLISCADFKVRALHLGTSVEVMFTDEEGSMPKVSETRPDFQVYEVEKRKGRLKKGVETKVKTFQCDWDIWLINLWTKKENKNEFSRSPQNVFLTGRGFPLTFYSSVP
jgi:hypothetical protein